MEKQTIRVQFNYDINWQYGTSLEEIKQNIEELEKLGATHIDITSDIAYGESYIEFEPYAIREETDEEYDRRIKIEEEKRLLQERREKIQLQKLKEKYEKD